MPSAQQGGRWLLIPPPTPIERDDGFILGGDRDGADWCMQGKLGQGSVQPIGRPCDARRTALVKRSEIPS